MSAVPVIYRKQMHLQRKRHFKMSGSVSLMSFPCCVNVAHRAGLPLQDPYPSETSDRCAQDGGKRLSDKRERACGAAETQPQVNEKYRLPSPDCGSSVISSHKQDDIRRIWFNKLLVT